MIINQIAIGGGSGEVMQYAEGTIVPTKPSTYTNPSTVTISGIGFVPDIFRIYYKSTNHTSFIVHDIWYDKTSGRTVNGTARYLDSDSNVCECAVTATVTISGDSVTISKIGGKAYVSGSAEYGTAYFLGGYTYYWYAIKKV